MDTVESARPVRFLLIRGANKDLRDQDENTALDMVENGEVTTQNLANDLRKMLVSTYTQIIHSE